MPDITMCCNYDCPLKARCYRYRAVPDQYRQSWCRYQPYTLVKTSYPPKYETECNYFWEVNEAVDKTLPMGVIENRYERDEKWKGIK